MTNRRAMIFNHNACSGGLGSDLSDDPGILSVRLGQTRRGHQVMYERRDGKEWAFRTAFPPSRVPRDVESSDFDTVTSACPTAAEREGGFSFST